MIAKRKRDELLTGYFEQNEEVLVNARDLVSELQQKDDLLRCVKEQNEIIGRLSHQLEIARAKNIVAELEKPFYQRFDVKG